MSGIRVRWTFESSFIGARIAIETIGGLQGVSANGDTAPLVSETGEEALLVKNFCRPQQARAGAWQARRRPIHGRSW